MEYYSFIPDGLPTVLKIPVPPRPKPPVPEFSTMPRPKRKLLTSARSIQEIPNSEELSIFSPDPCSLPSQLSNITFTTKLYPVNNNYVGGMIGDTAQTDDYIPAERLKLSKTIGEGEFGSVLRGLFVTDDGVNIDVAIKTLRNEHVEANRGAFLSEAQVMMRLSHHCVVRLIGVSLGPPLLMVQELVALGSMLSFVIRHKKRVNPNYEFKIWAAQIACGKSIV